MGSRVANSSFLSSLALQNFVQNKTMMEELQTLEKALGVLVCTFQRYCRKDGNQTTLSKGELRELLENELPSLRTVRSAHSGASGAEQN